jgi:hypothetical protein
VLRKSGVLQYYKSEDDFRRNKNPAGRVDLTHDTVSGGATHEQNEEWRILPCRKNRRLTEKRSVKGRGEEGEPRRGGATMTIDRPPRQRSLRRLAALVVLTGLPSMDRRWSVVRTTSVRRSR